MEKTTHAGCRNLAVRKVWNRLSRAAVCADIPVEAYWPMRSHWILLPVLLATMAALLFVLRRTRLGALLREHIAERQRRRLFIASVSFFLTFAIVRGMVFCIVHQIPPFHYVIMEGRHIHHLVFGILILLLVGYGWLCEVGNGGGSSSVLASSLMSLLY